MRLPLLWLLTAAWLAAACPAYAAAKDAAVESFTLANGLEVIVIPNHRVPAVSQMVWYRIGAGDDPLGKSGLAHFHEHVMFLGTPKYTSGEYTQTVARNGGQDNAFTGYDATSYYINIAKDKLPMAMALEADRMRGLSPSDEAVVREKQVIIEERRMRVENNPEALLSEQMNAALFRNHPYRRPVIGWMNEMEVLTKQDVLDFHKRWYHPNNAMLILSGDITAAEAKPLAEKYYGGLKRTAVPQRVWTAEPVQNSERRLVLRHTNVKQPSVFRSYVAPSLGYGNKDQAVPLFLLAQWLGGGKSSRLYKSLVVEQKLAAGVSCDYNGFTFGPTQLEINVVPERGVAPEKIEQALDKEIRMLLSEGIDAGSLARAKTLLKAETTYARDSLTAVARIMGWIRIIGLPTDYFNAWPAYVDAVTAEQVHSAASAVLVPEQSVTGILLPQAPGGGS